MSYIPGPTSTHWPVRLTAAHRQEFERLGRLHRRSAADQLRWMLDRMIVTNALKAKEAKQSPAQEAVAS